MKKYRSASIWVLTVILHAAVYFSGVPLVFFGISAVYILALLACLIIGEMRKRPYVEFGLAIFIGVIHTILLLFDLFCFFFLLGRETGNFHAG